MVLLKVLNLKVRYQFSASCQAKSSSNIDIATSQLFAPKQYAVNCQSTALTTSKMALSRRTAFQTSKALLRTTQRRSASHHTHDHHAEPVNESIGVRPTHHLTLAPQI